MDGSIRRLVACSLVIALAGCDPSPTPTQSPVAPSLGPTSAATASARPTGSPTPTSTASPSGPTSITIPAPFDAIPWAHTEFTSVDYRNASVSFGVLGQQARFTRTIVDTSDWDVQAIDRAIVIRTDDQTEIVDALTGETIATFDRNEVRLPDPTPAKVDNYDWAPSGFRVDVAHGYLYDMRANRNGVLLRRFHLDGTHKELLATLAPDPEDEFWEDVDFVVGPTGEVIATACPPQQSNVADHRCRLWRIPAGAAPPAKPRYLPAATPRPCFLFAASEHYLIGSSLRSCGADGGPPSVLPIDAIDLRTFESLSVLAGSNFEVIGVEEPEVGVRLLGNAGRMGPFPPPAPAIAVFLGFEEGSTWNARWEARYENEDGVVWAFRGRGPGWDLLQAFDPDYGACQRAHENDETPLAVACPLTNPVLRTRDGDYELAPGTWGEAVPPSWSPGF